LFIISSQVCGILEADKERSDGIRRSDDADDEMDK
jgi:hypothetical protein